MRYLFCALASHGYIYPAISIAQQLQNRGHEVAFVTGQSFSEVLEGIGLKRIPRGPEDGDSFTKRFWGHTFEIFRQIKHIDYACQQFAPDVLIATPLTYGPLIAARIFDVPVAVIGLAVYIWPTWAADQEPEPLPPKEGFLKRVHTGMWNSLAKHGKFFGVSIPEDSKDDYSHNPLMGEALLLRTVPELQGDLDSLPDRVHLVSDCSWTPPPSEDPELSAWVAKAKASSQPIIFLQHGTHLRPGVPDFWPYFVEAMAGLPIQVAASIVAPESQESDITIPENFLVRDHIPHELILPYVDGVVTLGSTAPTLNALTYGLPMLLVPNAGEEPLFAELCQQANVAINLPIWDSFTNSSMLENAAPEKLRAAVQEMLTRPDLRQNARRVQQALREVKEQEVAAQVLEFLAVKRGPITREEMLNIDENTLLQARQASAPSIKQVPKVRVSFSQNKDEASGNGQGAEFSGVGKDWRPIVQSALAILLPFFSEVEDEELHGFNQELYQWLFSWLEEKEAGEVQTALAQVKLSPESEVNQRSFIKLLTHLAEGDREFGVQVEERVHYVAGMEGRTATLVQKILARKIPRLWH